MKIAKSSNNRFLRITLVIVGAVVVLGGIGWYVYAKNMPQKNSLQQGEVSYDPATPEQQQAGNVTKQNSMNDSGKLGSSGSETPPQPTPIDGSSRSKVEVVITGANKNGSNLVVSTYVSTVTSSGTCQLTLTKSGQATITQQGSVTAGPSTSSCADFNVPLSQLSSGSWTATVTFTNDDLTGSASQDVVI